MEEKVDYQKMVRELQSREDNLHCADCASTETRWASITLGVFICTNCSGVHRHLGVHISKIRSIELDSWDKRSAERLFELGGNIKSNAYWDCNVLAFEKPLETDLVPFRQFFITNKYVEKQFIPTNEEKTPTRVFNPDMINRKGWLSKQGGSRKTWHRRWCILYPDRLAYFKHEMDSYPAGFIEMSDRVHVEFINVLADGTGALADGSASGSKQASTAGSSKSISMFSNLSNKKFVFTIRTPDRDFVICAENEKEMCEWVLCLRAAVHFNKNQNDQSAVCTGTVCQAAPSDPSSPLGGNLQQMFNAQAIEKKGWMRKTGGKIQTLKRRYFVLKGNTLAYYATDKDAEALGEIPLKGARIEENSKMRKKGHFPLTIYASNGRRYFIITDTEGELQEWNEAIKQVIDLISDSVLKNRSSEPSGLHSRVGSMPPAGISSHTVTEDVLKRPKSMSDAHLRGPTSEITADSGSSSPSKSDDHLSKESPETPLSQIGDVPSEKVDERPQNSESTEESSHQHNDSESVEELWPVALTNGNDLSPETKSAVLVLIPEPDSPVPLSTDEIELIPQPDHELGPNSALQTVAPDQTTATTTTIIDPVPAPTIPMSPVSTPDPATPKSPTTETPTPAKSQTLDVNPTAPESVPDAKPAREDSFATDLLATISGQLRSQQKRKLSPEEKELMQEELDLLRMERELIEQGALHYTDSLFVSRGNIAGLPDPSTIAKPNHPPPQQLATTAATANVERPKQKQLKRITFDDDDDASLNLPAMTDVAESKSSRLMAGSSSDAEPIPISTSNEEVQKEPQITEEDVKQIVLSKMDEKIKETEWQLSDDNPEGFVGLYPEKNTRQNQQQQQQQQQALNPNSPASRDARQQLASTVASALLNLANPGSADDDAELLELQNLPPPSSRERQMQLLPSATDNAVRERRKTALALVAARKGSVVAPKPR